MAKKDKVVLELGVQDSFSDVINRYQRAMGGVASGSAKTGGAMQKLSLGIIAVNQGFDLLSRGARVMQSIGRGFQDTINISKGLAEVRTLLGGMDVDMKAARDSILDIGVATGQAYPDLIKGLYDSVSAGIAFSDSMEFLETASRLAMGGVTDVATSVDGLTSIINAYGLEASAATEISDSLFTAVKAGKTTIAELSTNIGQLAPITAQAGISFDEMNAAIATVTKAGISTPRAITGLRSAILALIAPTGLFKEKVEATFGGSLDKAKVQALGLEGILKKLWEATDGNVNKMKEFGITTEGLPALLSAAAGGGKEFAEVMGTMTEKAGASSDAAALMAEELDTKLKQMSTAWVRFKDDVLLPLVPAVDAVTLSFVHWSNAINNLMAAPDMSRVPGGQEIVVQTEKRIAELKEKLAKRGQVGIGFVSVEETEKAIAVLEARLPILIRAARFEAGGEESLLSRALAPEEIFVNPVGTALGSLMGTAPLPGSEDFIGPIRDKAFDKAMEAWDKQVIQTREFNAELDKATDAQKDDTGAIRDHISAVDPATDAIASLGGAATMAANAISGTGAAGMGGGKGGSLVDRILEASPFRSPEEEDAFFRKGLIFRQQFLSQQRRRIPGTISLGVLTPAQQFINENPEFGALGENFRTSGAPAVIRNNIRVQVAGRDVAAIVTEEQNRAGTRRETSTTSPAPEGLVKA